MLFLILFEKALSMKKIHFVKIHLFSSKNFEEMQLVVQLGHRHSDEREATQRKLAEYEGLAVVLDHLDIASIAF
jgi:hypothetical protein